MTATLISARRAHELLWANLRLAVIDTETIWESGNALPDETAAETQAAIEQVRTTGVPVLLRPQSRRVRFFQHHIIEAAGLTSGSVGDGDARAVEVRPGDGSPPLAPPTATHEGRHRVVSVAVVWVVRGRIEGKPWHTLVNPGVPVDRETVKKHGLTNARLQDAPAFARIAPDLAQRLLPRDDETLVLVGHNVGFDAGVLRTEFALMDRELRDLPMLDTMGPLARTVGIHPSDGSLDALLGALRLTNPDKHSAAGDALATTQAAIAILRAATEHGIASVPDLLDAGGSRRTAGIAAPGRIRATPRIEFSVPREHLERHALLAQKPTKTTLAAWVKLADECAQLRCPDLGFAADGLVRMSAADPLVMLDALLAVLDRRAKAGDGPGANTALGAITSLFTKHCPMPAERTFSSSYPLDRRIAIATHRRAAALVAGLPGCRMPAACPDCREGGVCARTEFARALAPAVLDPTWKDGKLTRSSTLGAWIKADASGGWFYHRTDSTHAGPGRGGTPAGVLLADTATGELLRVYLRYGEDADRASRVRGEVMRLLELGCEDPVLAEMTAEEQAAPGREPDLEAAIATCDTALGRMPDPPDSAWSSLAITRDLLAGKLGRVKERKRIREDGVIEPVRVHHPGPAARRVRPLRFVRDPVAAGEPARTGKQV